jgi:hypothetical protein
MYPRLPAAAVAIGLAGLVPFIGLGIAALSVQDAVAAERYLLALVGYGGVVLAFLGGIHWGFVLHPTLPEGMTPDARRDATRLGLGVLPSLIGWAALLTPELGVPVVGLAVLIVGYVATILTEHQLRRRGALLPPGYMTLRWGLSIVVVMVLVTVLALRLIGAKIRF